MIDKQHTPQPVQQPVQPQRPNEIGSLNVEAHVKIHDPNNGEVFVEKRA